MELKAGDVVRLNSCEQGKYLMTINKVIDSNQYECAWFTNEGVFGHGVFCGEALCKEKRIIGSD